MLIISKIKSNVKSKFLTLLFYKVSSFIVFFTPCMNMHNIKTKLDCTHIFVVLCLFM